MTVPLLPKYAGAVKGTVTVCAVLPAVLLTTALTVGVPTVGALGCLPPESLGVVLPAMIYAEISPTSTQVSVALLMSVAYDH